MTTFLRFAHLLALGVWIGSVMFFSFFVAPTLFGALGRETAGRAVSAIFPRYYLLGTACGLVALVTGIVLGAGRAAWGRSLLAEIAIVAIMTGIVVYAGQVVLPQASRARADLAEERFAVLHRRSVLLNGAVLLLGVAAFALAAAQRPPR